MLESRLQLVSEPEVVWLNQFPRRGSRGEPLVSEDYVGKVLAEKAQFVKPCPLPLVLEPMGVVSVTPTAARLARYAVR